MNNNSQESLQKPITQQPKNMPFSSTKVIDQSPTNMVKPTPKT